MKHQITQHNARFDGVKIPTRSAREVPSQKHSVRLGGDFVYSSAKIFSILVLCISVISGFSQVGSTISYFSDTETSIGNRMQAGILNFRLSATNDTVGKQAFATFSTTANTPRYTGGEDFVVSVTPGDTSLPLLYSVDGELDKDVSRICGDLDFETTFGTYVYDGLFKNFAAEATSTMGDWLFSMYPPENGTGTTSPISCSGDIVFHAYLDDSGADEDHGYTDEQRYHFSLVIPGTLSEEDQVSAISLASVLNIDTASSTPDVSTSTPDTGSTTPPIIPKISGGGGGSSFVPPPVTSDTEATSTEQASSTPPENIPIVDATSTPPVDTQTASSTTSDASNTDSVPPSTPPDQDSGGTNTAPDQPTDPVIPPTDNNTPQPTPDTVSPPADPTPPPASEPAPTSE